MDEDLIATASAAIDSASAGDRYEKLKDALVRKFTVSDSENLKIILGNGRDADSRASYCVDGIVKNPTRRDDDSRILNLEQKLDQVLDSLASYRNGRNRHRQQPVKNKNNSHKHDKGGPSVGSSNFTSSSSSKNPSTPS
uniref:Uncharacterized protein n=1 Tax=Trichogramma kaykai TaxID=54128 RepID=A0ABD2XI31_9HYME